ncbi:MAG: polysaccharide biosynthesis protein [Clostridia bacterium]|nr:polysaccharide biosynthesis protein [Clostridia bacterium]
MVSYFVMTLLIHNIYETTEIFIHNIIAVGFTILVFVGTLFVFNMYRIMWVFAGTKDYIKLCFACVCAACPSMAFNMLFYRTTFYFKLSMLALVLASMLIIILRMSVRAIHTIYSAKMTADKNSKRLMIVGAGTSASLILRDIASNVNLKYNVICFIDDDRNKSHAIINGVQVMGTRYDIVRLAKELEIDEIMIAMPSATLEDRKHIIEICYETECTVKIMPSMDQMLHDGTDVISQIRTVNIEDLLAREPVRLDNKEISGYIRNKRVLVTGGGGSIGSELCRQIMKFKPKILVVLDIYENNAYDIQMELNRKYPLNKPEVVIASVRDMDRLEEVFRRYEPHIVFHAAAHKHVPLMEDSPGEAIKNNVFGTLNLTRCAAKYDTKKFVMISTDKAVNPTNVMGATKRICEMIVQTAQMSSTTEFVCVRFGNVLGSNGSVIPLFKKQIEEGRPVTVTDKRITRFFMTIPEAAQLVLQAASYAKGGEIFVLDMGEPIKIYDLAKNLIRLSGLRVGEDIDIVEVGLRPGEKLYEELLMDEEGLANTSHNKIFIGKPIDIDHQQLDAMLDKLREAMSEDDNERIKDVIAEVVPTYIRGDKYAARRTTAV